MRERQKQMARAQKAANRQMKQRLKQTEPGPPQTTTSVEDVSASSFSEPTAAQLEPASASADAVVAPVTVSASDAIATQDPEKPSQP